MSGTTGALQYWGLAVVFGCLLFQSCVSITWNRPFLTCLPIVHVSILLHEWIVVRFIHMNASMCMLVLHQDPGTLFSSWYEALAFILGIYSDHMFTKAVADICLSVCWYVKRQIVPRVKGLCRQRIVYIC